MYGVFACLQLPVSCTFGRCLSNGWVLRANTLSGGIEADLGGEGAEEGILGVACKSQTTSPVCKRSI